jgi:hypothetical protein
MSDKFDEFRNFTNKKIEEAEVLMNEAPEICPILGLSKCESKV